MYIWIDGEPFQLTSNEWVPAFTKDTLLGGAGRSTSKYHMSLQQTCPKILLKHYAFSTNTTWFFQAFLYPSRPDQM